MANCPRCDRTIDTQAIECPHCRYPLKAFGHPGIPLYQATETEYLCDRCIYDEDDTCNFPQRPHAKTCTLFRDRTLPLEDEAIAPPRVSGFHSLRLWLFRHRGLVGIAIVALIGLLLAL